MTRWVKKITIKYIDRKSRCPAGTQVFTGVDAAFLAALYQFKHPELIDKSYKVEWTFE